MPQADWKQTEGVRNSQDEPELEQEGACGSTLYQVQRILPSGHAEAEGGHRRPRQPDGTSGLVLSSTPAEEGAIAAAAQAPRASCSAFVCEHTVLAEVSRTTLLPRTFNPGCSMAEFPTGWEKYWARAFSAPTLSCAGWVNSELDSLHGHGYHCDTRADPPGCPWKQG